MEMKVFETDIKILKTDIKILENEMKKYESKYDNEMVPPEIAPNEIAPNDIVISSSVDNLVSLNIIAPNKIASNKIVISSNADNLVVLNDSKLLGISTLVIFRIIMLLIIACVIVGGLGYKYGKIKLMVAGIVGVLSCLSIIFITCKISYRSNNHFWVC